MSDLSIRSWSIHKDRCVRPSSGFVEFNKEEIEQPILDRFEKQVVKYPDHVAIKTGNHAITYDALNKAANRVARAILAHHGEEEEPIALLLEHGAPRMARIIGVLGVLKAGRFYVPLDPSYPRDWITYILEDSQAGLIVTNNKTLSLANELAQHVCPLINIDEIDTSLSDENIGLSISPDTLACILYTSGSTGQPKGVIQNHRNVLHRVWTYTKDNHVCPDDRQSLLFSYSFSASLPDIFGALLNGITLCPYNAKEEGLHQLANWLIQEEITLLHPPVTLFRQFLDTLTGEESFPKLRMVIFSGQTVYKRDVERFRRHFSSGCVLENYLGLTEANVITRFLIDHETMISSKVVPVGYPVEGMEILLLDDAGQEVGFNSVGEIVIKSRYLSPGYWRKLDLTRRAFLPDPEGGEERIYRTGDLGRMRPDGCLEHLGRKDFRVKIRGYRVEVAEIETALHELGSVKEVVVMAQEGPSGDKRLAAYVVPSSQSAPTASALRSALAERLPDYMIPSAFVMLDRLPLTPSGKVDRQALPVSDQKRPELERTFVAPRDKLERQLTEIWERVLGIRPIGVKDNFFDLGGHSLLAVRLFLQIERLFGKTLPLATLFQAPTVEQLAGILRQEDWSPPWSSLVAIQPGGSKPPFFCVPPAASTVLIFADLARRLGSEQPIYGLQPLGMDGEHPAHVRVEDMAAYYIKEIRTVQPEGPYFLGGMCFGGIVAFEMAQQLRAQGQEVALLAVLDTLAPPGWEPRSGGSRKSPRHYAQRLVYYWKRKELASVLAKKVKRELIPVWAKKVKRVLSSQERRIQRVEDDHFRARMTYVPQVYPGRITFFWSDGTRRRVYDPRVDWSGLTTDELEIHRVPGDHHSMTREPHARVLAEQLRTCLHKAQTAE